METVHTTLNRTKALNLDLVGLWRRSYTIDMTLLSEDIYPEVGPDLLSPFYIVLVKYGVSNY